MRSAGMGKWVERFSLPFGLAKSCACGYFCKHSRQATGVILFGMQGEDVIDLIHTLQAGQEDVHQVRFDRVHQDGLFAAADEIGIVAGVVGERDEGIEQPAFPIDAPTQSTPGVMDRLFMVYLLGRHGSIRMIIAFLSFEMKRL